MAHFNKHLVIKGFFPDHCLCSLVHDKGSIFKQNSCTKYGTLIGNGKKPQPTLLNCNKGGQQNVAVSPWKLVKRQTTGQFRFSGWGSQIKLDVGSDGGRPSDKGGASSRSWEKKGQSQKIFSALRASVWSKNKSGPSVHRVYTVTLLDHEVVNVWLDNKKITALVWYNVPISAVSYKINSLTCIHCK